MTEIFLKGTKAWIINEGYFTRPTFSMEWWQRLHCTFISDKKKYWHELQVIYLLLKLILHTL